MSTAQEIVRSSDEYKLQRRRTLVEADWTEFRFIPTPGWTRVKHGQYSVPCAPEWRFSPTGRLGVSIIKNEPGFSVLLMDVYYKLWFGHSLTELDVKYEDIFTYYMLNKNILIVVEILDIYWVKQHIILVDLETRDAEFIQTVVHQFQPRALIFTRAPWKREMEVPNPHMPLNVNGKAYTALVSADNSINNRRFIYLVPRNPLNPDIQLMEFKFSTILGPDNHKKIVEIVGPSYRLHGFVSPVFSFANFIHFPPSVAIIGLRGGHHHMLGVYLTVDVSKLIDIHNKPGGMDSPQDQWYLNSEQADAIKLVVYPFDKKLLRNRLRISCSISGAFLYLQPWVHDPLRRPFHTTCHILPSMHTVTIQKEQDWFTLHPCGALISFNVSGSSLYVKVASVYNNTLESIANSKAIFHPNRPIGTIEGLHQMVFYGLKPIPLDEKAKKALGTFDEYMDMLRIKPSTTDSVTIDIYIPEVEPEVEELPLSTAIENVVADSGEKTNYSCRAIFWSIILLLCFIFPFFM